MGRQGADKLRLACKVDISDAQSLWQSAVMWRLQSHDLNANIPMVQLPGVKPGLSLVSTFNQPHAEGADLWGTHCLGLGDELRVTAQHSASEPGEMQLSATCNGRVVVSPTIMVRCSFAMELWPYIAVCGRVSAVTLLRDDAILHFRCQMFKC